MLPGVRGVSDWSPHGKQSGKKFTQSTLTQTAESIWQRCAAAFQVQGMWAPAVSHLRLAHLVQMLDIQHAFGDDCIFEAFGIVI